MNKATIRIKGNQKVDRYDRTKPVEDRKPTDARHLGPVKVPTRKRGA